MFLVFTGIPTKNLWFNLIRMIIALIAAIIVIYVTIDWLMTQRPKNFPPGKFNHITLITDISLKKLLVDTSSFSNFSNYCCLLWLTQLIDSRVQNKFEPYIYIYHVYIYLCIYEDSSYYPLCCSSVRTILFLSLFCVSILMYSPFHIFFL